MRQVRRVQDVRRPSPISRAIAAREDPPHFEEMPMNAFALRAAFGPAPDMHHAAGVAHRLRRPTPDAQRPSNGQPRGALRPVLLATALLAGALHPAHAGTVYYIDLTNAAPGAIVAFDVAQPGTERFHSVLPGHAPLPGDGAAATITVRKGDGGCLRDLRVRFADGRSRTHRNFDLCATPAVAFEL